MDNAALAQLRKVSLFSKLDEDLLQTVARHSRKRRFKANEYLFHKDDPGYTLYIILAGHVHVQNIAANGEVVHIARRGPGEMFGEMSLIDGKPRMADVVTVMDCELLILDRVAFVEMIQSSPAIALHIMACLADRLRQAAEHLESQQEMDVLGRVAQILLQLLQAHGVDDPKGGRRITMKITQEQLAAQVGATRETVNRALNALKTSRVLRMDGRALVIMNEKKLRECCEPE